MPTLRTLILHNQQVSYELTTIMFDAFVNINGNLTTLFLSSNALTVFPHAVFEEEEYLELKYLHIDNNQISNLTEFPSTPYGALNLEYYAIQANNLNPFYGLRYLEELYISSNFIAGVNDGDLCNFLVLYRLEMGYNNLDEVTLNNNTFSCVPTITTLVLDGNNFHSVPEAVRYEVQLPSIISLSMASNSITYLVEGDFSNLTTLTYLSLASNSIVMIEDGTFHENIQSLYLSNNDFNFLHSNPFRDLSQLYTLSLSSNLIDDIPVTAFDNCTNLDNLYLDYNMIGRILRTTFDNCPLMGTLSLNSNELAYIEDGSFAHITSGGNIYLSDNQLIDLPLGGDFQSLSLNRLYLHDNRITSVKSNTFKDITGLSQLTLTNNQISYISRKAFNNIAGSSLDIYLTNNPLKVINPYSFYTISGGRYLSMGSMELATIPSNSFHDTSFVDITLSYNQIATIEEDAFYDTSVSRHLYLNHNEIVEFQGRMFGGSCSVDRLHLQNNKIPSLPGDVFDEVTANEIYLEYNKLTSFPSQALSTQSLQEIDISNNLISAISESAFSTHSTLELLDLSYNQVTSIPAGLLSPLTSLEEFLFHHNNISFVETGAFDGLDNLLDIDLQENYLIHWPNIGAPADLENIYLQNNRIYSFEEKAFSDLDNETLVSVNFDGNPVGCDCWLYKTLSPYREFIVGGECGTPARASGVTFNVQRENSANYFRNVPRDYFRCTPPVVNTSAPAYLQVALSWEPPSQLYPQDPVGPAADWLYYVNCTTGSSSDLSAVTNRTVHLFEAGDGVEYGTEYGCSIQLHAGNHTSIATVPAYVTTIEEPAPVSNTSLVDLDVSFTFAYYDFSLTDTDFSSLTKTKYDSPTYIPSPYGSWLAISDNPTADSFSHWFRDNPSVNYAFEFTLTADWDNTSSRSEPINRYYSSSYFPLDGLGFLSEGQKDCSGVLHNLGFTSALRTAIKMNGTEQITLGGGEEIWFYVNQILLLQIHGVSGGGATPCKTISLSDGVGGGYMVPQSGTIVNGRCIVARTLNSEQVYSNFYLGDSYRFDVFHTEREPCSSEFLFEIQGAEFISSESETPPVDYSVHISEGLHVDGLIETVWIADAFSTGPTYNVTITSGNGARHFTIKNDTVANRNAGEAATTEEPSPTHNINGTDFIVCQTDTPLIYETFTPGTEEFSANTDTILVTLSSEVDYEVNTDYLLKIAVVDSNASPPMSGVLTVQIYIDDINDHCPILPNETLDIFPLPVLRQTPIVNLTAGDLDNGVNGEVTYHSSIPYISQIGNSTKYLLEITVAALDGGSPTRGDVAYINVTITDTCVFDAQSEILEQELYMGYEDGGLYLRVPKYYLYEYNCKDTLGMQSGVIQDDQISASSTYNYLYQSERGRLAIKADPEIPAGSGWIAGTSDANQWFQIDMEEVTIFGGVVTQGSGDEPYWVTSYKVAYSNDSSTWVHVKDTDGSDRVFTGNSNQNTQKWRIFDDVYGRYIRILPQSWNGEIALRVELLGCTPERRLRHLSSCERCLTTYYCIGDGLQRTCGRCEDDPDNCDRSPTEHAFGHASECSPCPNGWICHDGYADVCPKYTYAVCNTTYCPDHCTNCEPGTACFNGIQTICPPGYYSKGTTSELCIPCEPGSYQDQEGQDSCECCPAGFYSTDAKTSCSHCQITEYSLGDCTGCQSCASIADCPCMSQPGPCTDGVTCVNTGGSGTYRCLECPDGMEGSGNNCTDIDECDLFNPCWDTDSCVNLSPGYECGGCPPGYYGGTPHGIGVEHALANQQTCTDEDECLIDNGGCDVNVECVNIDGGFSCGACPEGYLGNGVTGCIASNYCDLGKDNCHQHATCVYTGAGTFTCQCDHYYAGNGQFCEEDPDLDGVPTISVSCLLPVCAADNCFEVPNSGQEDNNGDQLGDVCDADDDNEGIYDDVDNCPFVANKEQTDSDADGVGDDCDNCLSDYNPDQLDFDEDGSGDECDADDDDDGVLDAAPDNCQFASNSDQSDSDGDGVGDICDNCPDTSNSGQADTDQNGYGDSCDTPGGTNQDRDGDGVLDLDDNCISIANADQSDNDSDDVGDACDSDKDGDGVPDSSDNCPMVSNSGQTDTNGDGVGDPCEDDYDGDGVEDPDDHCPKSAKYSTTDFSSYTSVKLDASLTNAYSKEWVINDAGKDIRRVNDTEMPSMLIGLHGYGPVDYSGTWYVNGDMGENFIGIVFGYQSNRKFYLVMWKHDNSNSPTYAPALRGLQIKKVSSSTGPSSTLANAIWYAQTVTGETELLWHDPAMIGWEHRTPYKWKLSHRPSVGQIRLIVWKGASILVDSGDVYDTSYAGGRLGVFVYDQPDAIWSGLKAECAERVNQALMLDGTDDYVTLPTVKTLSIDASFTLETWMYIEDGGTSSDMPVLCSSDGNLCFSVQDGITTCSLGQTSVFASSSLVETAWNHIAVRYDAQNLELSVFVNGTLENMETSVPSVDWDNSTLLYIGRDNGTAFLEAILDEVRIWGLSLLDSEIEEHLQLPFLERQKHKRLLDAHFTMDNEADGDTTLLDQGIYSHNGIIEGGALFVSSSLDAGRFELTYPDARRRKRRGLSHNHEEL